MKAVLSNRIFLTYNQNEYNRLKSALSYSLPIEYGQKEPVVYCDVKQINEALFSIPAGREDLIRDTYTEITDKRTATVVDNFPRMKNITLRPDQLAIFDKATDSTIINALPSFGKTYTTYAIMSKYKYKALVITPTTILRDQWVDDCEVIYGITPGVIGGGYKENIDRPIVIGNIQTVTKMSKEIRSLFGFVAWDEAHRMAADTFISTANLLKPRIRIGLTGTLGRKDGKHVYIPDYINNPTNILRPVYSEGFRMTPKVTAIHTEIKVPGNVNIPWANRVNYLFDTEEYIYLLISTIHGANKKGHKVLVLASRVEILTKLSNLFQRSKLITGNTSQKDREIDFNEIDYVFATTSIMKEGVSYPPLSAVVLADPISNPYMLEQIIGRIQRNCEDKIQPEIFDIVLSGNTGTNQFSERLGLYMRSGYAINNIQFQGGYE